MNSREFFKLVKEMREWQSTYFKTRSQDALAHSKSLERRVDNEIARVINIMIQRGEQL